jgi:purine-cytosine permease-like protein
MMTGFGLGWVNMAADYSRYLPRNSSSKGVVWWTTFGAAIAPIILVLFGLLLIGSKGLDSEMATTMSNNDPIGALTEVLPTWYLVPFGSVAILGLIGGAVLDIYSSGLALISAGLPFKRPVAAGIDGVSRILGTIYSVFGGSAFSAVFQGFLITLGVPIAVWAGIMLADVAMRRKNYDDVDLFRPQGRYGSVPAAPMIIMLIGSVIGWGFVVNSNASWLEWQGYLLGIFGGKDSAWAGANLGVLFALVIGFVATMLIGRGAVQRQEAMAPATLDEGSL